MFFFYLTKLRTKFSSPVAAIDGKDILSAIVIYDSHLQSLYNTISPIKLKSKQIAKLNLNQVSQERLLHLKAPVKEALDRKKYSRCEHQRRCKKE